ncbi:hypothetical protein SUGI_0484920 [Cryptomeria japonica]|nr:hypothetical protein SUGI_0484920 [Cryptomeria japonica]
MFLCSHASLFFVRLRRTSCKSSRSPGEGLPVGCLICTRRASSLIRIFLEINLSKECCVPPYSVPLTSIKRSTLKGIATELPEVPGDWRIALEETVVLSKGIGHPLYQVIGELLLRKPSCYPKESIIHCDWRIALEETVVLSKGIDHPL